MKKMVLIVFILLSGCVVVGDFPENRERLHNMNLDEAYCNENPEKCIEGIPW